MFRQSSRCLTLFCTRCQFSSIQRDAYFMPCSRLHPPGAICLGNAPLKASVMSDNQVGRRTWRLTLYTSVAGGDRARRRHNLVAIALVKSSKFRRLGITDRLRRGRSFRRCFRFGSRSWPLRRLHRPPSLAYAVTCCPGSRRRHGRRGRDDDLGGVENIKPVLAGLRAALDP